MVDNKNCVGTNAIKVGVLGAGQLGKMMAIEAANWHLSFTVMDKADSYPAAPYASAFVQGDFNNEADVLRFGRQMDVLTIEIEHVNTKALKQLQAEGIKVYPQPEALEIIQDKGLQKEFYQKHAIASSPFKLYENEEAIRQAVAQGEIQLPFVQKARKGGYDGKGVAVIKTQADLTDKLLAAASVVEELVDIEKELAVIVARNERGELKSFPLVEMVFDEQANLVDYLQAPASVSAEVEQAAIALAEKTATAFNLTGLLAIELFLSKTGAILVNEVAPRTHNSGHHTIESCPTSQFAQHIRSVLNLPLGDTSLLKPAVMINILGEAGHTGEVVYEGMEELLAIPQVFVHLYGKTHTKPYRKMGHITVLGDTLEDALAKAQQLKPILKCKSLQA